MLEGAFAGSSTAVAGRVEVGKRSAGSSCYALLLVTLKLFVVKQ